jgi:hypothetical protein
LKEADRDDDDDDGVDEQASNYILAFLTADGQGAEGLRRHASQSGRAQP